MKKTIALLTLALMCSCKENKIEKEVEKIPVSISLQRFDSAFFQTPIERLPEVKKKYPYLFPASTPDSLWAEKKKDTLQNELYQEVKNKFISMEREKEEFKDLFKHIKYYFPKFKEPKIVTLTTEVDYHSRVVYADSLLFIGLDNYLGADHRFYAGMPEYIKFSFDRKYMPVDVAREISAFAVPQKTTLTFLEAMIESGKRLYVAHLFLPKARDCDLLKYPEEKYNWAVENQSQIWRYFVENNLLYDTDKKTLLRFIDPAPFSKFYMELDNQSPGEVGKFIGYEIVKAYMEKYPESLDKMLVEPAQELFVKSKYKPKK